MDRQQFSAWGKDFSAKFPESGKWLHKLPAETRDEWFDGLFANLELADCLAANRKLLSDPVPAYERERIPSKVALLAQEIAYEREQQQRRAETSHRGSWSAVTKRDPVMKSSWHYVAERMRDYRATTGEDRTPRELIRQWAIEAGKLHDEPDDDGNGPRYRCPKCLDSGFAQHRDKGAVYSATCSDCEIGERRAKAFSDAGRTIAETKNPARVAAFDEFNRS